MNEKMENKEPSRQELVQKLTKECEHARLIMAREIYIQYMASNGIQPTSTSNFENNLKTAKWSLKCADYFLAATLQESSSWKALKRRINGLSF